MNEVVKSSLKFQFLDNIPLLPVEHQKLPLLREREYEFTSRYEFQNSILVAFELYNFMHLLPTDDGIDFLRALKSSVNESILSGFDMQYLFGNVLGHIN